MNNSSRAHAVAAPVFIGGCPRSGTTLLRVMLDSHPDIACGSELRLVHVFAGMWRNIVETRGAVLGEHYGVSAEALKSLFAAPITEILDQYRLQQGKTRVAEKTPANVTVFPELHELFPSSPLVHVIRDGRDVVASLQKMSWHDDRTGKPLDIVGDARAAASTWVECVRIGRSVGARADSGRFYHEVRYEELVREPRQVLRALLDFLGLPWSEHMLQFHRNPRIFGGAEETSADQVSRPLHDTAIGRWRRDLDAGQIRTVMEVAGPMLAELGYG